MPVDREALTQLVASGLARLEALADPSGSTRVKVDERNTPPQAPTTLLGSANATVERVTLVHLCEVWKRTQTRPRTIAAVEMAIAEFHQLHGVLPVDAIERQQVRDYRDALIGRSLSDGTIENRLGFLARLVRFGQEEIIEDLVKNPFGNIPVHGGKNLRVQKDRRAFDIAELNLIFGSPLYRGDYRPKGQAVEAAYWAPLLGPFLGARIEEVAQLRIEDVQCINGSWCLRICDLDDEQTIKNEGSFRRVPLHRVVIQSGFLKYAAEQARLGHERLFPSLSNANANHIWSNSLGKFFGRYLDGLGLHDPRLDYHSYRYSFRQQCSLSGLGHEARDALTGHWMNRSDSGRTYMKGANGQYPYPALVQAIEQLRYDELNIAHLFVDEPLAGVAETLLR